MKNILFSFLLLVTACANAQRFTPKALARINSTYDEQNPVLSADGNLLYFTVAGHPQNIEGKRAVGDIWYSRWEGSQWSVPIHAGTAINSKDYNAIAAFFNDGAKAYLFNHYSLSSEPATSQGISFSRKTLEGWSAPENITIPYFLNKSLLISGQLSEDGNVLVYSAEGYGTKGVEDIYVSIKDANGVWSEPKNMGSTINTSFQELCPSLSWDKSTLYFSSNKPGGFGSFDIYTSKRLDESWTNWSAPQNMGATVNTDGRELYFKSLDHDQVKIYTSTTNSDGYGDIKLYDETIKTDQPEPPLPIQPSIDNGLMVLSGVVSDSKSGILIAASLQFKADTTYNFSSDNKGVYRAPIKPLKVYSLKVEASGYIPYLEKLDLTQITVKEIALNIKLQPIEVGAKVNLKSVLFKVSETKLLPESYDELNAVVDLLKANPKIEIELSGHTDSRGDAKLNLKLSQGRVDKVKEYLVGKGIKSKRVQGKGYGGQKPIATGDTEESRKLNRRVEFTIVKD